ncbi:uncharacterized protein [Hyperolius riggenbachi]|uniref:uncharacterized protein n=1 Tax=Hyperolius riggenbachi TaxID=752182 RepID=UPI0035A304D2
MPMTCVAYGCNNNFVKGCGKQFFRFPMKDPERLSKWVVAIRRKHWKPSASCRICSDHFTDKDYMLRPGAMVPRLRLDAVPSIFNGFPKHLKERLERKKQQQTDDQVVVICYQMETQHKPCLIKQDQEKPENTAITEGPSEPSLPEPATPGTELAENQEEVGTVLKNAEETVKKKTCVVCGCNNTLYKGCKKQFFRFPLNDPECLSKWIAAVQRKNWKPSRASRICSDHFIARDYVLCPEAASVPKLRFDAVPSIFNTKPKPMKITDDPYKLKEAGKVKNDPLEKSHPATCAVYGCNNTFGSGKKFFRFPIKNPERFCKWIEAIQITKWKPSMSSKICGDHFKDKDYIQKPGKAASQLHASAVPSVFKIKRSRVKDCKLKAAAVEQGAEMHMPPDHTYSAPHSTAGVPPSKPNTIKLKKKVRTLQRQVQRQRHTIKFLAKRIAQLKNTDLCSVLLPVMQ